MEITEIRIHLVTSGRDKLRAFCSITFDRAFVVRDLKIIEGTKGVFVAMPSRKATQRCLACGTKNTVGAKFCNECSTRLPPVRAGRFPAPGKLHTDIAHPIHAECRKMIQDRVLDEYQLELEKSRRPGYQPASFDDFDELAESPCADERPPARSGSEPRERDLPARGKRGADLGSDRPARGIAGDADADRKLVDEADSEPEDKFGAGLLPS